MAVQIGRLEKVLLRDIWPNEAYDFTRWLSENIDLLGEVLGVRLSLEERESPVGPFAADIVATDERGEVVVVENQLEKTDHDHLGKLLTYMVNLGAKTAVWIAADPRPEHVKVVDYLNEVTPDDTSVYLVRVEAYRIGDSPPAPLFTVVAGPSREVKEIGKEKKGLAERHKLRREFWEQLLAKAKSRIPLHANVSPTTENWLAAGAGKSGLSWVYVITMNWAAADLYIDRGPNAAEENEQIFDAFYAKKEEIEQTFGGPLIWDRMEGCRACRIRAFVDTGGLKNRERWPEIQEAMISAMEHLYRALQKEIQALR